MADANKTDAPKDDAPKDDGPKDDGVTYIVYADKNGTQRRVSVATYLNREKDGEL